jgi:rsbT co-antagonist protein RsbR
MTSQIQLFGSFLRTHTESRLDAIARDIAQEGTTYGKDPQVREKISNSYMTIVECIEQDNLSALVDASKTIGHHRVESGFSIQEVLQSFEIFRKHIWLSLDEFMATQDSTWQPAQVRHLEDFLHTFQIYIASAFGTMLEKTREELQQQSEQLEGQRQTIRELSTPILPVHEGVLVLPLVGAVDSNRATQVMETLLEAIAAYQADMVIIDITGVPVVDTSVANYILQAARAAKLVGASVILVGIGSEIAQTIVHLGVDLSDIMTLANLQEGLEYAYERLGISLASTPSLLR